MPAELKAHHQRALDAYGRGELETCLAICAELGPLLGTALKELTPQQWQQRQQLVQLHGEQQLLMAAALHKSGRTGEAIPTLEKLLKMYPEQAAAHFNLSLMQLYAGDYENGWREFEWRRKLPEIGVPVLDAPSWQGEDISDRTILVVFEQGFGDCLSFGRFLPLTKERADRVVLAFPPALEPLYARQPWVDEVTQRVDASTRFDVYAPICSLAGVFAANPANLPPPDYLALDSPGREAKWQARINPKGFNVGIAWSGSSTQEDDLHRSADLGDFLRLLDIPGLNLYSLQLHDPVEGAPDRFRQFGTGIVDFGDTAAIARQLDLVISVDTAIAHLAPMFCAETWVLLTEVCDWRWQSYETNGGYRQSDDPGAVCSWYPAVRRFRQHRRGDWTKVFAEVGDALRERVGNQ